MLTGRQQSATAGGQTIFDDRRQVLPEGRDTGIAADPDEWACQER